VRNFSRYHKYSIGQDLRDGARRVLKLIVRANARGDKSSVLFEVRKDRMVPRPGIEPGLEVPETSVMSFSLPGRDCGRQSQKVPQPRHANKRWRRRPVSPLRPIYMMKSIS
jgi:hypothetical protein